MAFRNHRQKNAFCRELAERLGIAGAWTLDGPTEVAHAARNGAKIFSEHTEYVTYMTIWAIFDADRTVRVADLLVAYNHADLAIVGEALTAMANGMEAVDAWLAKV